MRCWTSSHILTHAFWMTFILEIFQYLALLKRNDGLSNCHTTKIDEASAKSKPKSKKRETKQRIGHNQVIMIASLHECLKYPLEPRGVIHLKS